MHETQETWVRSLGQGDPPEWGVATHSNVLAWNIPRTEDSGRLQSMGPQRVRHGQVAEHPPYHTSADLRKVFNGLASAKPMVVDVSFPKFWFSFARPSFVMGNDYYRLFSWKWQAVHPSLNNRNWALTPSFKKNDVLWRKAGSLVHNSDDHTSTFPWRQQSNIEQKCCGHTCSSVTQRVI